MNTVTVELLRNVCPCAADQLFSGTVQLWSPNVRVPLVKMLAHPCTVRGIAVEGNYMATTGLDRKLRFYWLHHRCKYLDLFIFCPWFLVCFCFCRIWDVRKYQQLYSYTLPFGLAEVSFSQRSAVACAVGNVVQVSFCHLNRKLRFQEQMHSFRRCINFLVSTNSCCNA